MSKKKKVTGQALGRPRVTAALALFLVLNSAMASMPSIDPEVSFSVPSAGPVKSPFEGNGLTIDVTLKKPGKCFANFPVVDPFGFCNQEERDGLLERDALSPNEGNGNGNSPGDNGQPGRGAASDPAPQGPVSSVVQSLSDDALILRAAEEAKNVYDLLAVNPTLAQQYARGLEVQGLPEDGELGTVLGVTYKAPNPHEGELIELHATDLSGTESDRSGYVRVVTVGDKRVVLVVLRGTTGRLSHWGVNFDWRKQVTGETDDHWVAKGFYAKARSMENELSAILKRLQIDDGRTTTVFTGHSQGAALATILADAMLLENMDRQGKIKLVTFAAPRSHSKKAAQAVEDRLQLSNIKRLHRWGDGVPALTGMFGFKHVGEGLILPGCQAPEDASLAQKVLALNPHPNHSMEGMLALLKQGAIPRTHVGLTQRSALLQLVQDILSEGGGYALKRVWSTSGDTLSFGISLLSTGLQDLQEVCRPSLPTASVLAPSNTTPSPQSSDAGQENIEESREGESNVSNETRQAQDGAAENPSADKPRSRFIERLFSGVGHFGREATTTVCDVLKGGLYKTVDFFKAVATDAGRVWKWARTRRPAESPTGQAAGAGAG
jgi:hypothetical protein